MFIAVLPLFCTIFKIGFSKVSWIGNSFFQDLLPGCPRWNWRSSGADCFPLKSPVLRKTNPIFSQNKGSMVVPPYVTSAGWWRCYKLICSAVTPLSHLYFNLSTRFSGSCFNRRGVEIRPNYPTLLNRMLQKKVFKRKPLSPEVKGAFVWKPAEGSVQTSFRLCQASR